MAPMMAPMLRLYEDVLANDAEVSVPAPPAHDLCRARRDHDGRPQPPGRRGLWQRKGRDLQSGARGGDALALGASRRTAKRAPQAGRGVVSREKLSARLDTMPKGAVLLRGDSVAFPPGGCAYLHRHQGPGIRCLLHGGIRIDTKGHSTSYGPGGAWFESGPDPVFAQAADTPTRFIRVMILPMAYLARSSVEYLNEEDKAKPKSQSYKIFVDMPIAIATSPA